MVAADQTWEFEGLRLDPSARTLLGRRGEEISLRRSEYELLLAFVTHSGRALSRDFLLDAVARRRSEPYDRSIDVLVGRLRRKIELDLKQPRLILTVPGVGYRFAAKPQSGSLPADPEVKVASIAGPRHTPVPPERRQLTVMQCALSGPAFSYTQRDPEWLHQLLAAFHASCAEFITSGGGTVARLVEDGLVAYFGYPQTREYQAECAVRAALSLIEAAKRLDASASELLHTRVGIATGLVVVGDLLGSVSGELAALGEAPRLASRLVSVAEADTVLVSGATHRLLGGLFRYRSRKEAILSESNEPATVWQVIEENTTKGRFEALHEFQIPGLVGREEELALLVRRWEQACASAGRVVLVTGEPGIGKSRLLRALDDRIASKPHLQVHCSCSPHHQDSALYPIIGHLERAAGFARGDSSATKRRKLTAVLPSITRNSTDLALLSDLLSIPCGEAGSIKELTPQQKKGHAFDALLRGLDASATRQPVLMVFEDLHWMDPTSLELLDRIVAHIERLPVLLIATFRPEFHSNWVGQAHVTMLVLPRLGPREGAALIHSLAGEAGETLPARLVDEIIKRSDGVPLFIEELTKCVLESPEQGDDMATALTVPTTLQASLMARLDRLPLAKRVAQVAAAIGREFTHALLATVARLPDERLTDGIDELVASELVFRRGVPPDAFYTFKHALVRDAAYESLVRGRRAEIHANIANALERDVGTVERQPVLLGYHYAQAGLMEKAATYYRQAGDQSKARGALTETKTLLDRGLALAVASPDSPGTRLLKAELWTALGRLQHMVKNFGDDEALTALERAVDFARTLDNTEPLTGALRDLALNRLLRGDHEAGWRDVQELFSVSLTTGDAKERIFAYTTRGNFYFAQGRFEDASADLQIALQLYSDRSNAAFDVTSNSDWAVGLRFFLAHSLACLGRVDQATAEVAPLTEQVRWAAPFPRAVALNGLCRLALITHDVAALREYTTSLASIGQEAGSLYALLAGYYQGFLGLGCDSTETVVVKMRTILNEVSALNYLFSGPYYRLMLAETLMRANQKSAALMALNDGLTLSAKTGETWADAELHRGIGEVLLRDEPDHFRAEQELCRAIDIARGQGAKLFELRAATSLGRLWSGKGRRADAGELLALICARFTEGSDTPDLVEAKSLLRALG